MKVKRVLHIIGSMERAGAETMLMNLYRNIDRSIYQFDFLYFTEKPCDYDDEIISLGGVIYRIENSNLLKRTIDVYNLLKTEKSFYAVHGHTLFSNGFNMLAAYFANYKRRVVHSHNTADVKDDKLIGKIYHHFSRFLINSLATRFVACGEQAGNYLFYSNKEIIQLPNAIDINFFNQCGISNKNYIRKELNIDSDCLIISQVGRLLPVKNHEFSIKLASNLKEKKINFHMIFVGDGKLKSNLIKMVEMLNLKDEISFLGVRDDIPNVLAGSNVMLMPSYYEGFPVVLVEAQAVGVPSIVSNHISKEVDLGVEKVFFHSLENIDNWVYLIQNIDKVKSLQNNYRLSILSSKGYDINDSVKILEKLYQ